MKSARISQYCLSLMVSLVLLDVAGSMFSYSRLSLAASLRPYLAEDRRPELVRLHLLYYMISKYFEMSHFLISLNVTSNFADLPSPLALIVLTLNGILIMVVVPFASAFIRVMCTAVASANMPYDLCQSAATTVTGCRHYINILKMSKKRARMRVRPDFLQWNQDFRNRQSRTSVCFMPSWLSVSVRLSPCAGSSERNAAI